MTSESLQVAIIGAGPHALALLSKLHEFNTADPYDELPSNSELFYHNPNLGLYSSKLKDYFPKRTEAQVWKLISRRKRAKISAKLGIKVIEGAQRYAVFDPMGKFLESWNRNFNFLGIKYLRSTIQQHPDPTDMLSFWTYTKKTKQMDQLADLDSLQRTCTFHGPFLLPSSKLFHSYVNRALIKPCGFDDAVNPCAVSSLVPVCNNCGECEGFMIHFNHGGPDCFSKHLVLAIGPGSQPNIPDFVYNIPVLYPKHRLMHYSEFVKEAGSCDVCDVLYNALISERCHSDDCDKCFPLLKRSIVIVGGGQTSMHLAQKAVELGAAKVTLIVRHELIVAPFDLDPIWMGHRRPQLISDFWSEADMISRVNILKQARHGGKSSVTEDVYRWFMKHPRTELVESAQIEEAIWTVGKVWELKFSNRSCVKADFIWLATGNKLDITTEPILKPVFEQFQLQTVAGFPILNDDLSLKIKGSGKIFITGAYSALQVGPGALNLMGSRICAARVFESLSLK